MTHSLTPKQSSDVDIAYQLLLTQGRSMYYYDLIQGVLQARNLPMDPEQVSAVLTQINLDTRFTYVGKGEWGLKVWVPSRSSRKLPTITLMNKALAYDDEDSDSGEEKDPLIEEELEEDMDDEGDSDSMEEEDSYKEPSRRLNEDSWD